MKIVSIMVMENAYMNIPQCQGNEERKKIDKGTVEIT
jgi:hypothetical protein